MKYVIKICEYDGDSGEDSHIGYIKELLPSGSYAFCFSRCDAIVFNDYNDAWVITAVLNSLGKNTDFCIEELK